MSVLDQPCAQANGAGEAQLTARPSAQPAAERSASPETLEFLAWVASCPRTYAMAMEVWQTSCPRHAVWEDALGDGLVECGSADSGTMAESSVTLTPRGRAVLNGRGVPRP